MAKNYYTLLGIEKGADEDEIHAAYRDQVTEFHPDVSDVESAETQFKALTHAYDTLSDPLEQKSYNRLGHRDYVAKHDTELPAPILWEPHADLSKIPVDERDPNPIATNGSSTTTPTEEAKTETETRTESSTDSTESEPDPEPSASATENSQRTTSSDQSHSRNTTKRDSTSRTTTDPTDRATTESTNRSTTSTTSTSRSDTPGETKTETENTSSTTETKSNDATNRSWTSSHAKNASTSPGNTTTSKTTGTGTATGSGTATVTDGAGATTYVAPEDRNQSATTLKQKFNRWRTTRRLVLTALLVVGVTITALHYTGYVTVPVEGILDALPPEASEAIRNAESWVVAAANDAAATANDIWAEITDAIPAFSRF